MSTKIYSEIEINVLMRSILYTTTTPQSPRGHTTRARAYAIGHKVNPLLNASPFHSCETWLLPHAKTLHVLRYQEDPLEDARNIGQVPKYMDEEARRRRTSRCYKTRTADPWKFRLQQKPSRRAPISTGHPAQREPPDIQPLAPKFRTLPCLKKLCIMLFFLHKLSFNSFWVIGRFHLIPNLTVIGV